MAKKKPNAIAVSLNAKIKALRTKLDINLMEAINAACLLGALDKFEFNYDTPEVRKVLGAKNKALTLKYLKETMVGYPNDYGLDPSDLRGKPGVVRGFWSAVRLELIDAEGITNMSIDGTFDVEMILGFIAKQQEFNPEFSFQDFFLVTENDTVSAVMVSTVEQLLKDPSFKEALFSTVQDIEDDIRITNRKKEAEVVKAKIETTENKIANILKETDTKKKDKLKKELMDSLRKM